MPNLNKGDIVWLKSGSPPMTVSGRNSEGHIICSYFDGNKKYTEIFDPEELTDKQPGLMPLPPMMG
jgi:uncharacterized protein YodC (DUF2158 family)